MHFDRKIYSQEMEEDPIKKLLLSTGWSVEDLLKKVQNINGSAPSCDLNDPQSESPKITPLSNGVEESDCEKDLSKPEPDISASERPVSPSTKQPEVQLESGSPDQEHEIPEVHENGVASSKPVDNGHCKDEAANSVDPTSIDVIRQGGDISIISDKEIVSEEELETKQASTEEAVIVISVVDGESAGETEAASLENPTEVDVIRVEVPDTTSPSCSTIPVTKDETEDDVQDSVQSAESRPEAPKHGLAEDSEPKSVEGSSKSDMSTDFDSVDSGTPSSSPLKVKKKSSLRCRLQEQLERLRNNKRSTGSLLHAIEQKNIIQQSKCSSTTTAVSNKETVATSSLECSIGDKSTVQQSKCSSTTTVNTLAQLKKKSVSNSVLNRLLARVAEQGSVSEETANECDRDLAGQESGPAERINGGLLEQVDEPESIKQSEAAETNEADNTLGAQIVNTIAEDENSPTKRCAVNETDNALGMKSVNSVTEVEDISSESGDLELAEAEIDEADNTFGIKIVSVIGGYESPEPPDIPSPIKLTKTEDVTKIKSWKKKFFDLPPIPPSTPHVFAVEPITGSTSSDHSYSVPLALCDDAQPTQEQQEEFNPAFVSDTLDEFLSENYHLKISYEVPKLMAEEAIANTDGKYTEARPSVPVSEQVKYRKSAKRGRKPSGNKAKTLAEKRMLLADKHNEELEWLERVENATEEQKKIYSAMNQKLLTEDEPFSKRQFMVTAMFRNKKNYVEYNNRRIKVTSTDAKRVVARICDVKSEPCKRVVNRKNSLLGSLKGHSITVSYKPGPLCKKDCLQNNRSDCKWSTVLKPVPRVSLTAIPEFGKPFHPRVQHFLKFEESGMITEDQIAFALAALKAAEPKPISFPLTFNRDQQSMMMLRNSKVQVTQSQSEKPSAETDDQIRDAVKIVVEKLLSCAEVSSMALDPTCDDSLSLDDSREEGDSAMEETASPRKSNKRPRLQAELRRLNCRYFEVEVEREKDPACKNEFCRMGCICDSLKCDLADVQQLHCGRAGCMFKCVCNYRPVILKKLLLPPETAGAAATINRLQDKAVRNLAKAEKEFTHTIVKANNQTIILGSDSDNKVMRQRRATRAPKKYEDFKSTPGEPLHGLDPEDPALLVQYIETCGVIKPCCVEIERHDFQTIIPFCLVHNLYKCHCNYKVEYVRVPKQVVTGNYNSVSIAELVKVRPKRLSTNSISSIRDSVDAEGDPEKLMKLRPSSANTKKFGNSSEEVSPFLPFGKKQRLSKGKKPTRRAEELDLKSWLERAVAEEERNQNRQKMQIERVLSRVKRISHLQKMIDRHKDQQPEDDPNFAPDSRFRDKKALQYEYKQRVQQLVSDPQLPVKVQALKAKLKEMRRKYKLLREKLQPIDTDVALEENSSRIRQALERNSGNGDFGDAQLDPFSLEADDQTSRTRDYVASVVSNGGSRSVLKASFEHKPGLIQEVRKMCGINDTVDHSFRILKWHTLQQAYNRRELNIWYSNTPKLHKLYISNIQPGPTFHNIRDLLGQVGMDKISNVMVQWLLTSQMQHESDSELLYAIMRYTKPHYEIAGYCRKKSGSSKSPEMNGGQNNDEAGASGRAFSVGDYLSDHCDYTKPPNSINYALDVDMDKPDALESLEAVTLQVNEVVDGTKGSGVARSQKPKTVAKRKKEKSKSIVTLSDQTTAPLGAVTDANLPTENDKSHTIIDLEKGDTESNSSSAIALAPKSKNLIGGYTKAAKLRVARARGAFMSDTFYHCHSFSHKTLRSDDAQATRVTLPDIEPCQQWYGLSIPDDFKEMSVICNVFKLSHDELEELRGISRRKDVTVKLMCRIIKVTEEGDYPFGIFIPQGREDMVFVGPYDIQEHHAIYFHMKQKSKSNFVEQFGKWYVQEDDDCLPSEAAPNVSSSLVSKDTIDLTDEPDEVEVIPQQVSAPPGNSTAPQQASAAPGKTSTAPQQASAATSTAPQQASSAPQQTATAPQQVSAVPGKTSTGPQRIIQILRVSNNVFVTKPDGVKRTADADETVPAKRTKTDTAADSSSDDELMIVESEQGNRERKFIVTNIPKFGYFVGYQFTNSKVVDVQCPFSQVTKRFSNSSTAISWLERELKNEFLFLPQDFKVTFEFMNSAMGLERITASVLENGSIITKYGVKWCAELTNSFLSDLGLTRNQVTQLIQNRNQKKSADAPSPNGESASSDPSPPTLSPITAVPSKPLSENAQPPTLTPIIAAPPPNNAKSKNTAALKVTPLMIVSDKHGSANSEQTTSSQVTVRKLGDANNGIEISSENSNSGSPRKFIIARIQSPDDPVAKTKPILLSNSKGTAQVATFAKLIPLKNDKVIKRLLQDKDGLTKVQEVHRK